MTSKKNLVPVPYYWSILMIALSAIYLLPEAVFNSMLVTVVGSTDPVPYSREDVEIFGRAMSGIGSSLLVADLLVSWLFSRGIVKNRIQAFILLAVSFVVTFPTVYYGQKELIESTFIEKSTAEDRQLAMFSQLVKEGLIANAVVIDGIPYAKGSDNSPLEKTFLGILPSLMYANADYVNSFKDEQNEIVTAYFQAKFYEDLDLYKKAYKDTTTELGTKYQTYKLQSEEYNKAFDDMPSQMKELNAKLDDGFAEMWTKYETANRDAVAQRKAKAKEIAGPIYKYFKTRKKCDTMPVQFSKPCKERVDAEYKKGMDEAGLSNINPSFWATDYGYSIRKDHYEEKILILQNKEAVAKYGFPLGLKYNELRATPEAAKEMRTELSKNGIYLESDWSIDDQESLEKGLYKKIEREAMKVWQSNPTAAQYNILPNLNFAEFSANKEIQKEVKAKFPTGDKTPDVIMGWNDDEFKANFMEGLVNNYTSEVLTAINSSLLKFKDGGELEEQGKNALRATLVPPISMWLSLALVILTIIKLPAKSLSLITKRFGIKSAAKVIKLVPVVMIVVLGITPFVVTDGKAKNETLYELLESAQQNFNSFAFTAVEWQLSVQPIVYPVGAELAKTLGFEALVPLIHDEETEEGI